MRRPFRFTRDIDITVGPGRLVAYKAGHELIIPLDHANAAISAGAGDYVPAAEAPRKKKAAK